MLQRGAAAVGIGELALRDAAGLDEEGQEVPRRHDAAADVADAVRGEQDGRSEAQHPVAVLLGGGEHGEEGAGRPALCCTPPPNDTRSVPAGRGGKHRSEKFHAALQL